MGDGGSGLRAGSSSSPANPTPCPQPPSPIPHPQRSAFHRARQYLDAALELGQVDLLVGGVVVAGVAGAVGDDRAVPGRADEVHVGGASLDLEAWLAAGGAD